MAAGVSPPQAAPMPAAMKPRCLWFESCAAAAPVRHPVTKAAGMLVMYENTTAIGRTTMPGEASVPIAGPIAAKNKPWQTALLANASVDGYLVRASSRPPSRTW